MTTLEAGLRGGAVALLLLLAIAAVRDARRSVVDRYSAVFDLCAIAYLIESAPALRGVDAWWIVPVRMLSNAAPAVFQIWTAASFRDGFVPRWWRWAPFILMLGLSGAASISDSRLAWRAVQVCELLLVAAGAYQALAGRDADLVEKRRRARLVFACGIGFWIVVTTVLGAIGSPGISGAGGVLGIALAAALLRLRLERRDAPTPERPLVPQPITPNAAACEIDPDERALHERLRVLMETERIYREGGLTVATLAQRLAAPEYRLRRLINQRLGYRNFVSFVNGYRLAEAMAALADPAQARVPVLTIALDAGFQSIGPFNRAFKAQTGETPTDYRRKRLAALADFGNG